MSAYVVNDNTINTILGFADEYDLNAFDVKTKDDLGQILLDENYRSVNYRYGEDATPETYAYSRYTVKTLEALQYLSCLEYQSCETPDWETTQAFRLCARLRKNMVGRLLLELGAQRVWDAPSGTTETAAL